MTAAAAATHLTCICCVLAVNTLAWYCKSSV